MLLKYKKRLKMKTRVVSKENKILDKSRIEKKERKKLRLKTRNMYDFIKTDISDLGRAFICIFTLLETSYFKNKQMKPNKHHSENSKNTKTMHINELD